MKRLIVLPPTLKLWRTCIALAAVIAALCAGPAWAVVWTLEYNADSYPDAWYTYTVYSGSPTRSVSGGILTQTANSGSTYEYLRNWSASDAVGVTVEARVAVSGDMPFMIKMYDGTYGTALNFDVTSGRIKLTGVTGYYYTTVTSYHTYRITIKDGYAQVYVDGGANPVLAGALSVSDDNFIAFGKVFSPAISTVYLDYLHYSNQGAYSPSSFSFVHITDLHVAASASADVYDLDGVAFGQVIDSICALSPKPAFVVATGDICHAGEWSNAQYPSVIQHLFPNTALANPPIGAYFADEEQTIPVYFVTGNHDYRVSNALAPEHNPENFPAQLGPLGDYVIDKGNAVIIGLNSGYDANWPTGLTGDIDKPEGSGLSTAQILWLDERLDNLDGANNDRDDSGKKKIIFMHHPAVADTGTLWFGGINNDPPENRGDGAIGYNRVNFLDICALYSVDVVLTGHEHQFVDCDRTGANWTSGTRYIQTAEGFRGCYRTIDVNSSVTVSAPQRFNVNGETVLYDEFLTNSIDNYTWWHDGMAYMWYGITYEGRTGGILWDVDGGGRYAAMTPKNLTGRDATLTADFMFTSADRPDGLMMLFSLVTPNTDPGTDECYAAIAGVKDGSNYANYWSGIAKTVNGVWTKIADWVGTRPVKGVWHNLEFSTKKDVVFPNISWLAVKLNGELVSQVAYSDANLASSGEISYQPVLTDAYVDRITGFVSGPTAKSGSGSPSGSKLFSKLPPRIITFPIVNGDFESSGGWTTEAIGGSVAPIISLQATDGPYAGSYYAKITNVLGTYGTPRAGFIRQTITIPSNATTLNYVIKGWRNNWGCAIGIKLGSTILEQYPCDGTADNFGWTQRNWDVSTYLGQTLALEIYLDDRNGQWSGYPDHGAWIGVDNVSISTTVTDLEDDFDDGNASDWSLSGLWHVTSYRSSSPSYSLAYNQESTHNYDVGSNSGSAIFDVKLPYSPALTTPVLEFDHCRWVESYPAPYDVSRVEISTDGGSTWGTLRQWDSRNPTTNPWERVSISLSGYTGAVKIRFYFNTIDGLYNAYEGWYIDNVMVKNSSGKNETPAQLVEAEQGPPRDGTPEIPSVTQLLTCAPNPTVGHASISYQLASPAKVSLKVYNIQGQLVKTLASETKPAGYHSVAWDGRDESGKKVAAGVYLYRMQAGDYTKTNKMTVLR